LATPSMEQSPFKTESSGDTALGFESPTLLIIAKRAAIMLSSSPMESFNAAKSSSEMSVSIVL